MLTTRAAALNGFVDLARSYNLDPDQLMQSVGLDAAALADQDNRISAEAVNALVELAAERSVADFGLRLSELRGFANLGPVSLGARDEPTVRDALSIFIEYVHLHNEALSAQLVEDRDIATFTCAFGFPRPVSTDQAVSITLSAFVSIMRQFLGWRWRPVVVCFSQPEPADTSVHRRIFRGPVEFDHEVSAVLFRRAVLDEPNPMAHPELQPYARNYLRAIATPRNPSTLERARLVIQALLPAHGCSADLLADRLGMTRRTLHRQLGREGASYMSLVNSARRDLAMRHLTHANRSMSEIADILGFSSGSAFTKWFRAEYGCTPRTWRSQQAAPLA